MRWPPTPDMKQFFFILLFFLVVAIFYFFCRRADESPRMITAEEKYRLLSSAEIQQIQFDGHIRVKVNLNGDTVGYWFLWDTGASRSMMDLELVEKYNLAQVGKVSTTDFNSISRVLNIFRLEKMAIGNAVFEDFIVTGFTSEKPECVEKKEHGIIGADVISKINWLIDYRNKNLYAIHPDSLAPVEKLLDTTLLPAVTIPFVTHEHSKRPKISINVDGKKIGNVIVDTGDGSVFGIHLPMTMMDELNPFDKNQLLAHSLGDLSGGLFGASKQEKITVRPRKVQIGDLDLEDQTVTFSTNVDKIIGNGMLFNYRVFLDYRNHQLHLCQWPDRKSHRMRVGYGFGLKLDSSRETKVAYVYEASSADHAGLVYGDEIVRINGKTFEGNDCEIATWLFQFAPEKIEVEVKGKGLKIIEYEGARIKL